MISSRKSLIAIALLSPVWIAMPVKADYTADFSKGALPEGVKTANDNGLRPVESLYQYGFTADGWTVERFASRGYVAMSPTRTDSQTPCANRLTLPAMRIEEGMWLRFEACSMLPDFLESLRVEAREEGSGESLVLVEMAEVESRWATRMVSLEKLAGKTAEISFVCTSADRYMLMLGDVFVGTPSGLSFETADITRRFQAVAADGGEVEVALSVLNTGEAADLTSIECGVADGETVSLAGEGVWPTGERRELRFTVDAERDRSVDYIIEAVAADSRERLAEGAVWPSAFERRLFVDKGTGMWCNNCPTGSLALEQFKEQYPGSVIACETHSPSDNDVLANDAYWSGLSFFAVPYFKLNRLAATAYRDCSKFGAQIEKPVRFDIAFRKLTVGADAEVEAIVRSSEEIDNADDRYRVGYVVTGDFYRPDDAAYYQINGATSLSGGRYRFLPGYIPARLVKFHDVTLSDSTAFTGMERSLPASLEPMAENAFTFKVPRPEKLGDWNDGRIVAFVIDTTTGKIENAAAAYTADSFDYTGVESVEAVADGLTLTASADGQLTAVAPEGARFSIEVFSLQGSRLMAADGISAGTQTVPTRLDKGIYLARLSAAGRHISLRFIIR